MPLVAVDLEGGPGVRPVVLESARKGEKFMKTNEEPRTRKQIGLRWFAGGLLHPIFSPEADERRFLAGLPIALVVVLVLWGRGWFQFLGVNPVLVVFTVWCTAYVIRFWGRLKNRGELKRAIIAPAVFVGLLVGVSFY